MNDKELKEFALNGLQENNIQHYLYKHKKLWNSIKDKINSSSGNSSEKLWLIAHNFQPTICKICNKPTKWNRKKRKYNTYCSSKCSNSDIEIKEKIKQTNMEKYGVDHPLKRKEIKEKIKQTNMEKYGVDHPLKNEKVQEKIKQTNMEKYGVERPAQNKEIKNKTKHTNLKKYRVEYTPQNKKIRKKQVKTLMKNYGVSVPMKNNKIKNKLKQTQLHTVSKIGKYPSQYHIPIETLNLLKNKEFLYEEHITKQQPLTKIAQSLNIDPETVRQYCIKHNITVQHFYTSNGEQEINKFLQEFNIKTSINNRSLINPYEIDIYIPEHKLAIEYCGLYWHSEQAGKNKHYHKKKYDLCKGKNIQLITIFEDEWLQKQKQVKSKLLALLNKDNRKRIYARQTNIEIISKYQKTDFFNENHIQGDGPSSINIGLIYDNELVACMGFIKQGTTFYLNRYATSAHVIGGFSKLLKYFQRNYSYMQLISFADLRWSNGNLYEKTGWKLDKILSPDYYYSLDAISKYHKFNFRRKNLPKLLKYFDPNVSEKVNCDNNGVLRIWDCGKYKYIYERGEKSCTQ